MTLKWSLLLVGLTFSVTACAHNSGDDLSSPCPDGKYDRHVCSIPFELLYSHRDALLGRMVAVDGILVVGVRPEPPGSSYPVALLFQSSERAKICNLDIAIELTTNSSKVIEELKRHNGQMVGVRGHVAKNVHGQWLSLEMLDGPSMRSSVVGDFNTCMVPPPPPPPAPQPQKARATHPANR